MRSFIITTGLVLSLGCPAPPTVIDTSDTEEEEEETGDTSVSTTPVWENLSLETSTTLTAAYASGSGFYAVTEGGECWLRQSNQWTQLPIDVEEEDLNGLWGSKKPHKALTRIYQCHKMSIQLNPNMTKMVKNDGFLQLFTIDYA